MAWVSVLRIAAPTEAYSSASMRLCAAATTAVCSAVVGRDEPGDPAAAPGRLVGGERVVEGGQVLGGTPSCGLHLEGSAYPPRTGYVIWASGPLLVGILHDATGGWRAPIGFLLVALAVQTCAGALIARPRYIEDEC